VTAAVLALTGCEARVYGTPPPVDPDAPRLIVVAPQGPLAPLPEAPPDEPAASFVGLENRTMQATSEAAAKLNLDYSLGGPLGSLYVTGEYRKGDFVSSGRFALESIDVAEVLTPDDAFGPGYFAYRTDAKAWLGTFGYNRPLGPRDALDFSYRRVQVTPTSRPTFEVNGPFRYIDNQYSIIYLMRF